MMRKTSRWPPPTQWQVRLMGTYLRHRELTWAFEDMKKALKPARSNAKRSRHQPWLAYHDTTL